MVREDKRQTKEARKKEVMTEERGRDYRERDERLDKLDKEDTL